jgi:hypothetical protein
VGVTGRLEPVNAEGHRQPLAHRNACSAIRRRRRCRSMSRLCRVLLLSPIRHIPITNSRRLRPVTP